MTQIVPTTEEMMRYGTSLLTYGTKFLLFGDLGTGKTTLTKGIASGLDIDPHKVQSPTYTYIHVYEDKLLHIDMRRLEHKEQLISLGILDLIDHYPYIIIERPKWTELYADPTRQVVTITQHGDKRRCTHTYWQNDTSE